MKLRSAFDFHAQLNKQSLETLTSHINKYSVMQAIFIWFEHYIRRSRRFKYNFNFSYNSWCALLNANRYQQNLQYRQTSSELLLGKHCVQRTFNSFHFCRRRNYLTSSILHFSTAWGHNIFSDTAISTSYNLIFYSPQKNISNLNTDNKKLHCRTSWRYISTFLGSLLATYCVYCLEWSSKNTFFSISGSNEKCHHLFLNLISINVWMISFKINYHIFLQGLPLRLQLWLHS